MLCRNWSVAFTAISYPVQLMLKGFSGETSTFQPVFSFVFKCHGFYEDDGQETKAAG